jgi:hypothetical protein
MNVVETFVSFNWRQFALPHQTDKYEAYIYPALR